jgi:hypothetical protein
MFFLSACGLPEMESGFLTCHGITDIYAWRGSSEQLYDDAAKRPNVRSILQVRRTSTAGPDAKGSKLHIPRLGHEDFRRPETNACDIVIVEVL